jgi:hypothetical protein
MPSMNRTASMDGDGLRETESLNRRPWEPPSQAEYVFDLVVGLVGVRLSLATWKICKARRRMT